MLLDCTQLRALSSWVTVVARFPEMVPESIYPTVSSCSTGVVQDTTVKAMRRLDNN